MNFQDIVLVSDLDGTLIGENYTIPQRNIDAIERFKKNGGHFAIASGRSISSGARYFQTVTPNAPCILINGTVLHDFEKDHTVSEHPLPAVAADYIHAIAERFPNVGIEVFTKDRIFVLRESEYVKLHLSHESLPCKTCGMQEIEGKWCKGFFATDVKTKEQLEKYLEKFPHDGVRFVASSEHYLEMMPAEIDKGTGLTELAHLIGIKKENVYAIGDYYNDIELLQSAGFAAVPQNAPDDMKAMANLVVSDCKDGAVADLISYIEHKQK